MTDPMPTSQFRNIIKGNEPESTKVEAVKAFWERNGRLLSGGVKLLMFLFSIQNIASIAVCQCCFDETRKTYPRLTDDPTIIRPCIELLQQRIPKNSYLEFHFQRKDFPKKFYRLLFTTLQLNYKQVRNLSNISFDKGNLDLFSELCISFKEYVSRAITDFFNPFLHKNYDISGNETDKQKIKRLAQTVLKTNPKMLISITFEFEVDSYEGSLGSYAQMLLKFGWIDLFDDFLETLYKTDKSVDTGFQDLSIARSRFWQRMWQNKCLHNEEFIKYYFKKFHTYRIPVLETQFELFQYLCRDTIRHRILYRFLDCFYTKKMAPTNLMYKYDSLLSIVLFNKLDKLGVRHRPKDNDNKKGKDDKDNYDEERDPDNEILMACIYLMIAAGNYN